MRSTRKLVLTIIACVVIVTAGGVVSTAWSVLRAEARDARVASLEADERIPNVKVLKLKAQTVEDAILVTGAFEPWDERLLSAEIAGKVEWRGVEEGDSVHAGQEMFRIDTDTIRAQLDEITAQEKWARQEFERNKSLTSKGAVGERDVQQSQAQLDMASAGVRARSIMLEKSVVKAPIDGIVDTLLAKRDEFVDMGKPLARIVKTDRLKATIGIPERDISYFKVGDKVRLRVDALPERTFEGTIYRIATSAQASTRTFETEIDVPNADAALKPGMIVRATLVRQTFPESILVPIFAIMSLEDKRLAFVEKDGIADARTVETGVIIGSSVQITSGLTPGDNLIVVGQRDLRPGGKISVKEVLE